MIYAIRAVKGVEEEQPVIERMRQMRSSGATLKVIVDALNGDGVPTRAGKLWNVQTVANILRRASRRSRR